MKALVTVELQLGSDLFFSLGGLDRIQHQIDVMLRAGLVSYDTVVIEITDDREIEEALSCAYVRDIRYPLLVWPFSDKVSVKQVGVTVQTFSVLHIALSANNRQQIVLIHHPKYRFRVAMKAVPL